MDANEYGLPDEQKRCYKCCKRLALSRSLVLLSKLTESHHTSSDGIKVHESDTLENQTYREAIHECLIEIHLLQGSGRWFRVQ